MKIRLPDIRTALLLTGLAVIAGIAVAAPPDDSELCDPFGFGCMNDIPVIGPIIQDAVTLVYLTVTGGELPTEPPPVEPPPVEPPSEGSPQLCDPFDSIGCISDLDDFGLPGSAIQSLVDLAYDTVTGLLGDGVPDGLPDQCDPTGTTGACLSDIPGVGDLFAGSGGNEGAVKVGVGVVDMTPDVGYAAGQYADTTDILDGLAGGDIDPFLTHKEKSSSYGVQSRLTARAIVIEGSNGKRVALVKTDNYLAQDMLMRRVGQILDANGTSGISHGDILYHVTHNHSAAYSSTLAWGVWLFEDAFDARFFENQARRIAQAIEVAAASMQPARMGATTVHHTLYKGNVVGPSRADDGTPAGYPLEFGDHGVVVIRFDALSTGLPIALWMNWGEHPESLDGHNLHSADFLAGLERFVERDVGAPLVFSQGDVGSSERSGNTGQRLRDDGSVCEGPGATPGGCPAGQGTWRDWNHNGYVQTERNVRYLADAVVAGFHEIPNIPQNTTEPGKVPYSSSFPVAIKTAWTPGPLSHPYPSVSNCRTEPTVEGDTGMPILGLPDCERVGFPGDNPVNAQLAAIVNALKVEGVPVPDQYDAPAFAAVEENLRLMLQTVRMGDVLLASCACEAQNDLILNIESRTDTVTGNIYDGFDWACLLDGFKDQPGPITLAHPEGEWKAACALQKNYYDPAEFPYDLNPNGGATNRDPAAINHMRAQVHNDAAGWDAPENALFAGTEPADINAIWGNFTKQEIQGLGVPGYKLTVGIGHAGDYNGYTVSFREYQNRDHYRKALTSYGPHTADYMATRLVRMAAELQDGPALQPEPHDGLAQVDELREQAIATALGAVTSTAYDAWQAILPMDVGPALKISEPQNITHFSAATFRWRGGSTQVDNPVATVQRQVNGNWENFADMSGEVQTRVHWPQGLPGVVTTYAGQFAWEWTANFEAYRAFPARLGDTPLGSYRFVVNGCINDGLTDPAASGQGRVASLLKALLPDAAHSTVEQLLGNGCPGGSQPYQLVSSIFTVSAFNGGTPPFSYSSAFPFIQDNHNARFCENCTFRPWSTTAFVADSDGDGVPDDIDQCPNEFGPASNNGCPLPADTTPNPFSFTSVSGVSQNTVVTSNVVTISGMDAEASASIGVSGGGNSQYRINGGAWTSAAGQISNGQTVQVRHTSATTANTVTETVLTVGGVSGKFRSTTGGAGGDTDPDAFGFETQTGVATGQVIVSNTIMPEGYNTATTVKAGSGMQYSLGCSQDNWTSAQGSISPGTSICVRHTSASTANTLRKTSLQIGKTVGYFSTRTAP